MVREASQTHAVWAIAVVEAGVFGFDSDKIAVEQADFDTDFLDKVEGEMSGERGWVVVLWAWEKVCVEQVGDGSLATHTGDFFVEWCVFLKSEQAVWRGWGGKPGNSKESSSVGCRVSAALCAESE